MYLRVALLLILPLLTLNCVVGQEPASAVLNVVEESLVAGDAALLASTFHSRVELTLEGRSQIQTKVQAQYVMSQFFASYPPSSFTLNHKGETGGTLYALGEYRSAKGTFEVNIFIRFESGTNRISELRFE